MDAIGTTGNFSNRSHRSMQHYCIGSPDAQLAKVISQFLYRVHSKLPKGPILTVRSSLIPSNGLCGSYRSKIRPHHYFLLADHPGSYRVTARIETRSTATSTRS